MRERLHADIAIIDTGAGGGTLAYALRDSGARILLLERGGYLPTEAENWSPVAVFREHRYKTTERWRDGDGRSFPPGVHTPLAETRRSSAVRWSACVDGISRRTRTRTGRRPRGL